MISLVVDIVVDIRHCIQGQQDEGHEVEGIEAEVPHASRAALSLQNEFIFKTFKN